MASEPSLEEREPISPELVLVSPPEVALRAREELRDPAGARAATAATDDPSQRPPTGGLAEPPRAQSEHRRSRALTAVIVAVAAAAAAAAGYFVGARYIARRADDGPAVQAAPATFAPQTVGRAAQTRPAATKATSTAQPHRRHAAAKAKTTAQPPRRHAAKATKPARRTRTHRAKRTPAVKKTKRRSVVAGAARFVPARTWAWAKSKGARAYRLKFLLNGRLVLEMRTARTHAVLPPGFRFRAGTYRWVVERIPPAANRRPIVDSTFVLTRAVAARANR